MSIAIRNIAVTAAALALGLAAPRAAEAPNPVAAPGAAAAPKPDADPLAAQEARLDEALKALDANAAPADLAPVARARIQEARALLKEDPKSDQARVWIASCSLMTEAAVTQLRGQQARLERVRLQDERIKAQSELVATQDEIFKLERGYASSLKADLDEQRRKAAAAKDEAEKRFSELNSALIQVSKDARGTIISMSDILFDVGKATLTQDLKTNLAKIAGILTIYKDANVQVEGHTDNVGGEEYNQKLSEKRASNVMEFLVNPGGIAAPRLTSVGYGFTKPLADNATKEGRQKNRRVDLVVMDKKAP
jgi:outer membrane protein OmpA-like peptidoglycan-associated protein